MKLIVNVGGFGEFAISLSPDIAPIACEKVISIAKQGLYDSHKVERLEPGFVLQPLFFDGNDPVMDEMIELEAKTNPANGSIRFERGTVAMAGNAQSACAAQFFITLQPAERLNGNFTVIGRITDGWSVIEEIEKVNVAEGTLCEGDQVYHYHYPEKDIIIVKCYLAESSG